MTKHILALIHGITPQRDPDVDSQYGKFIEEVREARLPFEQTVRVNGGFPPNRNQRSGPTN